MNIMNHLPVLIVILPLTFGLLSPFLSRLHKNLGQAFVIGSTGCSFLMSIALLYKVLHTQGQIIHYWMGNWEAPIGIEFSVDPLNAVLTMFICLIALLASAYSHGFIAQKEWLQKGGFYTLMAFLCVGLCGMTLTGDLFNFYVYLELASLSCYGLVAYGNKFSTFAAFRYLLIGTIGASFYLIGIGIMYALTGSLNMADMANLMTSQADTPLMFLCMASLLAAFGIKMAIFPFHVWQPDAYTLAHPGAAPLISGAMSKVFGYAMIRYFLYIFGLNHFMVTRVLDILAIIGAIGIIYGSIIAIKQTDFRRMLAYSSIAQLGYVALGIGLGNMYGVSGGFLHVLNHIFMKGGLFFAIGVIQYRYHIIDIRDFGGLHKKMPLATLTIVLGSLAMIGIPPTGGFFSKWYLMLGALQNHQWIYVAVLVASSLLNAVYFIRVLEYIFIKPATEKTAVAATLPKRNFIMGLPLLISSVGIVAMGVCNSQLMKHVIMPALEGVVF